MGPARAETRHTLTRTALALVVTLAALCGAGAAAAETATETVTLSTADWGRALQAATKGPVLGTSEQDTRIRAALEATQPKEPPKEEPPAVTSITDRLTADKTAVEVTGEPAGTTSIHVAVMQDLNATGVKYLDVAASTKVYTPPAGDPVVDMQAKGASGAIGGWAGRLQTVPATEPPKEGAGPHVAVIVEENRNRGEVIGSSSMPYLNGLAAEYGETTEWHGVTHPSLPNYLALASGSTQGQTSDTCEPSFSGETIGSQLTKAGVGWRAYMEGLPSAGSTACESGNYAKKHNPFAYFPGSNGSHVVPASQYGTDLSGGTLPPFVWYTPDLCNDGHNCSNSTVDASLKGILTPLLASKWYAENGTVIVTYDESNTSNEVEGNRVATVVINHNAKGRTDTSAGNHYGTLATVEDLYKVPRLGNAAGATTLAPLLAPATAEEPPLVEEPPAFSSMLKGLDIGGWDWASAVKDEAGAAHYVRSSYTHFDTDSQMGLLAQNGVTLLPLFFESGSMQELDTASHVETIVNWCRRYCHGGTYWAGTTDLGAPTVELVNEPGNPYLHGGSPQSESSKLAYADLTRKVHAALAADFPAASRPRELVSYDGGFEGDQYGRWLFSHGAEADGVTVHPYGGKSSREQSALGGRKRVTEAHESGLPVYVTEVGWPTIEPSEGCNESGTGDSFGWTEAQQAENITRFVDWARSLLYVADVTLFNYADYKGGCYGIVHAAGSPHKLSYAALAALE